MEFIKNNNITHIINITSEEKRLKGIVYKNIVDITDDEDQADAI